MSTQLPAAGTSPAASAPPPEAPAESKPEAKAIKPIKKGLPGLVAMKDDPQDEALKRFKAAKAEAAKSAAAAESVAHLDSAITDSKPSGAADRTQAADATTKADTAESEAPAPSDPAKQASDAAAPEAFEFAGEKWESRDKAEHAVKTLKGMHKSLVKRAEESESKAAGWYKEAERLKSELELARTGKPAPAASSVMPTQPKATPGAATDASDSVVGKLLEAVNPKTFEEIRERSGDTTALLWALSKLAQMQEERVNAALDSRFKPVEETTAAQTAVKRIVDTFQGVASLTDAGGDPLYPEFADPTFLNAAIHVWRELDMSEATAYSHKGVHAAYLAAKDFFARSGIQIAGSNTPTPARPSAASAAAVDKVAEAVAAGLNGKGRPDSGVLGSTVVPPMRPAAPLTPEADIRRRILAAETVNPKLGFAVTRRF